MSELKKLFEARLAKHQKALAKRTEILAKLNDAVDATEVGAETALTMWGEDLKIRIDSGEAEMEEVAEYIIANKQLRDAGREILDTETEKN